MRSSGQVVTAAGDSGHARPGLLRGASQSPAGAVRTTKALAVASEPQFQPEILRRVTGSEGSGFA